jgi:DNA-binding transcriptional LysR family regulator
MPRILEFLARHPDLEMEVVLDDRNVDLVQEESTLRCVWGGSLIPP